MKLAWRFRETAERASFHMSDVKAQSLKVNSTQSGRTLAAVLRHMLPGQSWSQTRNLISARRVQLNRELWLDPARRVKEGDVLEVLARPVPKPRAEDAIIPIRYLDEHIVVVEKPSGISTVRHPAERAWSEERRELVPTLDDILLRQLGMLPHKGRQGPKPRLRVVQRLDKETSGLVVFARSVEAERGLGKQFRKHSVTRQYLTIVAGALKSRTIRTHLVPDRGDGRRGSTKFPDVGKEAITHVELVEKLPGYSLLTCRLETGRTHQIRIHLAELGHPVCGERVYLHRPGKAPLEDRSEAPRLALHAAALGFVHPVSGETMQWDMPLPPDLRTFLDRLRAT
jgi:23S rRNA pseudouridine1911/1915/1917 synthase